MGAAGSLGHPGASTTPPPGGESLIGWQQDEGQVKAPSFHPAWQFRDRFYRPDAIARILDTLDEGAAVGGGVGALGGSIEAGKAKNAEAQELVAIAASNITSVAPPTIAYCDSPEASTTREIMFGCQITPAPAVTEALTIEATINGHSVAPNYFTRQPNGLWNVSLVIPEGTPDKMVDVALSVSDARGHSPPITRQVEWRGSIVDQKPKLWLLAVGVSRYPYLNADLRFPALDAAAFAAAMSAQKGQLYGDVETTVLINEAATLAKVKHRLRDFRKQMKEQDVVMVFLSGHGVEPTQDWAFVPYDARNNDEDTQLSGDDLNRMINALPGIKMLFLDSCFSGAALNDRGLGAYRSAHDKNRVINSFITAPTGVVVFSSSTGDQQSWEDPGSHHGAYTAALLEGLAGRAGGPRIRMHALQDYLDQRVPELTNQKQMPVMSLSPGMPSVTVAIVDKGKP